MNNYDIKQSWLNTSKYLYGSNAGKDRVPPSLVTSSIRALTVYSSGTGDRHLPRPHKFQVRDWQHIVGSMSFIYAGSNRNNSYITTGKILNAPQYLTVESTLRAAAYNKTLSQLNEKVRGQLDLSIDAFQMQQSRRMLRNVGKLINQIKKLKRSLKTADWRALTSGTGSKWLEGQYGWAPTINSIYDAFGKIVNPDGKQWEQMFYARAGITDKTTSVVTLSSMTCDQKTTKSYRCEIGICLSPPTNHVQSLSEWTSLNPLSIGWELLPFSFIVDWVFNIGGYLRDAETAYVNGSRFVFGYRTDTIRFETDTMPRYASTSGTSTILYQGSRGFGSWSEKERTVLTSYPFPKFPSFHVNLGSGRMLNAAALLSQLLRK